ncbi:hypothetical protein GCM10010343_13560 [Streptomyces avidinii]|nr:hypothetical protein GCM10010343_13560 [Streptomyces avidinii]
MALLLTGPIRPRFSRLPGTARPNHAPAVPAHRRAPASWQDLTRIQKREGWHARPAGG